MMKRRMIATAWVSFFTRVSQVNTPRNRGNFNVFKSRPLAK